jgi:hypothetical protein
MIWGWEKKEEEMSTETTSEMPIELELPDLKPGADWEWTFYVEDDNEAPIVTTGYTFQMMGRDKINGELIFEISTANGKSVMTAALGKFYQKLPASETALIDVKSIVWDCILTDAGGGKTAPFQGIQQPIKVLDKVTA